MEDGCYQRTLPDSEPHKRVSALLRRRGGSARGRRRRSVIGGVVLEKLIHGLQRLVIPINDLEILNRCRSLYSRWMEDMRDGESGSATDRQHYGQGTGENRPKLAAGGEEKRAPQAFKEALRLRPLFVSQAG